MSDEPTWPGTRAPQPYVAVAVNLDPAADNRIHDDDVARRYGFAGALVPGVELFALATAPFVAAWGEAWLAGGRLALRFRRPVYDGERVTVTTAPEGGALAVTLSGPDGSPRAIGSAHGPSPDPPAPDAAARTPAAAPLPDRLAAEPVVGPFGTVREPVTAERCAQYARAVGESSPLYEQGGLVHPGLLLRAVNAALMGNIALGPWVHTASDCRFLGLARAGEPLVVHSAVRRVFERKGHALVAYDAVVLSHGRPVAQVDHEAIWRLAGS